jgi:hypothetical protein
MKNKYKPRYFDIPGMNTKNHFMVGFEWNVTGSTGNSYTVEFNDGGLDCSCPGFGWQGRCKHVKRIATHLTSENYPKYKHV